MSTPDTVDWSALEAAYGPAQAVPSLLADLAGDDAARRAESLDALWGTVWHQGTVYPATPVVVPFLLDLVVDHRRPDGVRAEVAMLLASIGAASSFVVEGRWYVVAFARDDEDPVPDVELDEACRAAVAERATAFDAVLAAAPRRTRLAAVALVATVAPHLGPDARAALTTLAADDDPRVATAAELVAALAACTPLTADDVVTHAAVDAEVTDFLGHIPTWPPPRQAVEVVRECVEAALTEASDA